MAKTKTTGKKKVVASRGSPFEPPSPKKLKVIEESTLIQSVSLWTLQMYDVNIVPP